MIFFALFTVFATLNRAEIEQPSLFCAEENTSHEIRIEAHGTTVVRQNNNILKGYYKEPIDGTTYIQWFRYSSRDSLWTKSG